MTKKTTTAETVTTEASASTPAAKYVTAYQIHKMLQEKGIVRKPQMIYNYLRNNLIATEIVGSQKLVRLDVAEAWIEKFVAKQATK
mgnify:CR=1 FL=1